jgi:hypothetical protein
MQKPLFALFAVSAVSALAQSQAVLVPYNAWKNAVTSGDSAALAKLYSPNATTQFNKAGIPVSDEIAYWAGLKSAGMTVFTPRILEMDQQRGATRTVVRCSITSNGDRKFFSMQLFWLKQGGEWKIVAATRNPEAVELTRRLPQPPAPNVALYAEPEKAEEELKEGLAKAKKENKRVIVVFGGNWCYDCHVLDTTFHSKEFAPLVDANFVVVHINIGDDVSENKPLAARLGVALDKGVPSLGVLDPDGIVLYAQKNGEFESTVKIGPEDVRAFLEKWKPARS